MCVFLALSRKFLLIVKSITLTIFWNFSLLFWSVCFRIPCLVDNWQAFLLTQYRAFYSIYYVVCIINLHICSFSYVLLRFQPSSVTTFPLVLLLFCTLINLTYTYLEYCPIHITNQVLHSKSTLKHRIKAITRSV